MLEEIGTVVDVGDGALWVETRPRNDCSQCSSGSCTTSVVAKLFGARPNRLELDNSLNAKVGDQVVIGLPDDLLVRASVWAYLLPVAVMVFSTAAGSVAGLSEGMQSLLALVGLAAGLFSVHLATNNIKKRADFKPQLLRHADERIVIGSADVPSALF